MAGDGGGARGWSNVTCSSRDGPPARRAAPDREGPHGDRLHRGAPGAPQRVARRTTTSSSRPRSRSSWPPGPRHRPGHAPGGQADGHRRVAGHRLAEGVGRPGQGADRAVHLLRRVDAGRCAGAHADHQHGRPDHHGLRHPGAEGVLPPEDPGRRHPLLHRLHRARVGHRPGLAADPGRARRRRVRHQRPEDLHVAGRRRRLHLAGHPHRSRGRQAQGHLDVHRADGHPGHQGRAHAPARATTTSTTRSTRTSGCRRPTWSAARTRGGR